LKTTKFAAIDIGTNAIRLIFTNVTENGGTPVFKKVSLLRMPIRLGDDVFKTGKISDKKVELMVSALKGFTHIIKAHETHSYKACATSAMREAKNSDEVVARIKEETGIEIEIIKGQTEAEIIFYAQTAEEISGKKSLLYVDVGGGSTEMAVFADHKIQRAHSFDIGTLRFKKSKDADSEWSALKKWVKNVTKDFNPIAIIGSGGNINKIFKMTSRAEGEPLTFAQMKGIKKYLQAFSYEERIKDLNLNPDRADVIIPASKIFISIMDWAAIKKLYVPKIGLADGITRGLYEAYKAENKKGLKVIKGKKKKAS